MKLTPTRISMMLFAFIVIGFVGYKIYDTSWEEVKEIFELSYVPDFSERNENRRRNEREAL